MAPIKFEENIREKLQERELSPSKDSWNELSKRLGHAPAANSNRRLWMAVAAGFMGLLLVVSYMLTTVNETQPAQLVDENSIPSTELEEMIKSPKLEENNANDLPVIAIENEPNEIPLKAEQKKDNNISIPKRNVASSMKYDKDSLFSNTKNIEPMRIVSQTRNIEEDDKLNRIDKEMPIPIQDGDFMEVKVDAVVAAVREMEASNSAVTVEEIDALLSKAQRDIATNRMLSSGSNKIDPSSLLQDVETEMERSFRDKVFEALGEGYNKVRTAVVERNN